MLSREDETDLKAAEVAAELLESSPAERDAALEALGRTDPAITEKARAILELHERLPQFMEGSVVKQEAEGTYYGLPPGTMIGPYRIVGLIGRGGIADVYEAQQANIAAEGVRVAIKVLRPSERPGEATKRFQREVQTHSKLQHPAICQLFDAGSFDSQEGPRHYSVMELVRGQPITEYVRTKGLAVREKLELFVRVCEGVQHAHMRGIIHRDLKPANILVTDDGWPKLLDFGISKEISSFQSSTVVTAHWGLIGTPGYMSPERLKDGGGVPDVRHDVYALGAILYEILCGRLLHDPRNFTLVELFESVKNGEFERLENVAPHLRGDLARIAAASIHADAQKRYSSVGQLIMDIRAYIEGRPISLRGGELGYVAGKLMRKYKWACAGGIATITATLMGVLGVVWQASVAKHEAQRALVREQQMVKVTDAIIEDMYMSIMENRTNSEVLTKIVENTVNQLDAIVQGSELNPDLMSAKIRSYHRLSNLMGSPGHTGGHNYVRGREILERGRAIGEQLVKKFPEHSETLLTHSKTLLSLGFLEPDRMNLVTLLSQSLDLRRRALVLSPTDLHIASEYARAKLLYGVFSYEAASEDQLAQALAMSEMLCRAFPQSTGRRVSYAITMHELARKFIELDPSFSRFMAECAVEELELARDEYILRGIDPHLNDSYARHRAGALAVLAFQHARCGSGPQALMYIREAEREARAAHSREPHNLHLLRDLAQVLARASLTYSMVSRLKEFEDAASYRFAAMQQADEACSILTQFHTGSSTPYLIWEDILLSQQAQDLTRSDH